MNKSQNTAKSSLNIWPDHLTQGRDLPELENMLADLYEFYKENINAKMNWQQMFKIGQNISTKLDIFEKDVMNEIKAHRANFSMNRNKLGELINL
jgi:hypothetical protein